MSNDAALEEMKNKILLKRQALEAARATLNYQIKELSKYYSKEQVLVWRARRNKVVRSLRELPTEKQIQQGCLRVNYSNSTKFWK